MNSYPNFNLVLTKFKKIMWNYRKLRSNDSPMAEILNSCSDKSNIRLVIYHLSENHIECATSSEMAHLNLGDTARAIKADSRNNHAVLAIDVRTNDVYKIEDVPELPVASAVLLCVVTELLNGCVQPRQNQYGAPVAARQAVTEQRRISAPVQNVMRDASGRFVRQEPRVAEAPAPSGESAINRYHFRIGRG